MTVIAYQNLPLAAREKPWDASAAEGRVRSWAKAQDGPNGDYRRAFLWYDGAAAGEFGSYKLPIADVQDGHLTAIPRALFAVAGALQGARGGADIPEGDRDSLRAQLERYYAKMREAFQDDSITVPWQRSGLGPGVERRSVTVDRLEVRDASGAPCIVGHAALFNTPAQITSSFREQIAPGAFADSIGADDVRALFNHDPNFVLGRNKAGTLRLSEDAKGLAIEIDPPDTQWARDLAVSIRRGDISQMSFGFSAEAQAWAEDSGGNVTRTLKKVRLFDVSPVTYPAYDSTDVAVRGYGRFLEERGVALPPQASIETLRRRLRLAETQI